MLITPEGDLINKSAIRKIELVGGKVLIHYINGVIERYPLDGEWKKFLQELSLEERRND